jgi:hypothetical protein
MIMYICCNLQVLWERSNRNKAANESSSLHLVSSDMTGHIIVWDVVVGNPKAVLQEGNKPILGKKNETGKHITIMKRS